MLIGATADVPRDDAVSPEVLTAAYRAGAMNVVAGRQFNRGLRALFLSIGYLGWIAGPLAQILATLLVVAILTHRQFFSAALMALRILLEENASGFTLGETEAGPEEGQGKDLMSDLWNRMMGKVE